LKDISFSNTRGYPIFAGAASPESHEDPAAPATIPGPTKVAEAVDGAEGAETVIIDLTIYRPARGIAMIGVRAEYAVVMPCAVPS
jgi:hypothetical protein